MWGNGQTQVLAAAGKLLHDTTMIRSAEREACGLYTRLLLDKCFIGSDIVDSVRRIQRVHIAYDLRPMAVGSIRLYESTGKDEYLKMAGLAGSWLMGNNFAHRQMYDTATGRCYDGIRDSVTVNLNSGAESTIEGLYTLVESEQYPVAAKYLSFTLRKNGSTEKSVYGVFRGPSGEEITLQLDLKSSRVIVLQGDKSNEL